MLCVGAWYSNSLAWLLDPCGSHDLKHGFGQCLWERVAKRKTGTIEVPSEAELKTATVLRELHLNRRDPQALPRLSPNSRLLDLLYVGASGPGFTWYLAIENKLFGTADSEQLCHYSERLGEMFPDCANRQCVLLTLEPTISDAEGWVNLTWFDDVVAILAMARREAGSGHAKAELDRFSTQLQRLAFLRRPEVCANAGADGLKSAVVAVHSELLRTALNGTSEFCRKGWFDDGNADGGEPSAAAGDLRFGGSEKRLKVSFQSPMGVFVHLWKGKNSQGPQVFLPLGTNGALTPHLVLDAADYIQRRYKLQPTLKSDANALRAVTSLCQKYKSLFDCLFQHRLKLPLLLRPHGKPAP